MCEIGQSVWKREEREWEYEKERGGVRLFSSLPNVGAAHMDITLVMKKGEATLKKYPHLEDQLVTPT